MKKAVPFLLVTFLIIVCALGYYDKFKKEDPQKPVENEWITLGYKKEDLKKIESLTKKKQESLKKQPYKEGLLDLYLEKYFIVENVKRYLDYKEKYPEKTNTDIVKEINVHLDSPFYTNITPADMEKGNLILSNKYYKLSEDYIPENLVTLKECTNGAFQVTKETEEAFLNMCHDMKKENLHILAQSTYRSYEKQERVYNNYVKDHGQKWADKWSARPGHSEHQTGRVLDIVTPTTNFDTFKNSKEYQWLQENAHKYGFILRYPEGKEYLTGYDFESWHYRYIGKEHATKVHELQITFDEYYEYFIKEA